MLDAATLSPRHFFAYGAVLHEVGTLLALGFEPFTSRDTAALLGLRSAALIGGVATLMLTYLLGARLFSTWAGLLAVALLAFSAEQLRWSITAHPDTLQAALVTAGLLSVVRLRSSPSAGRVALAALLAGLAFSTKYGGALLLPAILVASWAGLMAAGHSSRAVVGRLIRDALIAGGIFVATFALTNPYALVEWRRSISQIREEVTHASRGHVVLASEPGGRWFRVLGASGVLGPAVIVLAPIGWLAAFTRSEPAAVGGSPVRRMATRLGGPQLVALWTAAYLAYLIVVVGYQEARYALPVFPSLCVFAAGATLWLVGGRRPLAVALATAALAITALPAVAPLRETIRTRLDQRLAGSDPRIAAGAWLEQSASPAASVLTDAYVYIPPEFSAPSVTFGLTAGEVERQRPVLIVVNEAIRGRFRAADGGERSVDGPATYEQRRIAYQTLEAGNLGCYRLLRDFGGVAVYGDRRALDSGAARGCGLDANTP
jgi:4-amino-4-deoxy-L-arabinose transferase-like glycosyltransferase